MKILKPASLALMMALGTGPALAEPDLPPFYEAVTKLPVEGKLGQVIAQEAVATSVPGAEAWRIAFISSDVGEKPTVSTALLVAPTGPAPKDGRPLVAWAHGTTGTAQNCGPSQVLNPAQEIGEMAVLMVQAAAAVPAAAA